ncbi:kinase [Lentzea sp. NPDC058450]|uniref:kinase n=1 Tax=Lentzea sp. NPDC058450 TaxID=3346505 RepID=UPI00365D04FD
MTSAVVLYGAPAAGKDTVTNALLKLGPFAHFERLKCGPGRTTGYRMVDADQLTRVLATPGEVIWRDDRYGATYLVDRSHVEQLVDAGRIPVLHLGNPQAVSAVARALQAVEWLVVELHTTREVARERIVSRCTGDTEERLSAYDSTPRLTTPDLSIDTGLVDVEATAQAVADLVQQRGRTTGGTRVRA